MRKILFSLAVALGLCNVCNAQKLEYRRSSIFRMLLPVEAKVDDAQSVIGSVQESFANYKQDKYDNHEVDAQLGHFRVGSATDATADTILTELANQKVAHKLILKWYGAESGSMPNMNLVQTRALYDAKPQELEVAAKTERGYAAILDGAASELISHTFVLVTQYKYLKGSEVQNEIGENSKSTMGKLGGGLLKSVASEAMSAANDMSGGTLGNAMENTYFVVTNTYLFQLDWNKEIQDQFEMTYWGKTGLNDVNSDFMKSDAYKLVYLGRTKDKAAATNALAATGASAFVSSEKSNEKQLKMVNKATSRATDGCFAKLQKENDVFKPLTQATIDEKGNVVAPIGMKEGLEGGEKFALINIKYNSDGTTTIEESGTITVDKKNICDNRELQEGEKPKNELTNTVFKGKGPKGQTAFMIRQKK